MTRASLRVIESVRPFATMRLAVAMACVLFVSACSNFGWRGFKIDNQTSVPITVTATVNGSESTLAKDLQPGLYQPITGFPGTECRKMLLIARDGSGAEVARSDQEVCLDQTWVVRATGGS